MQYRLEPAEHLPCALHRESPEQNAAHAGIEEHIAGCGQTLVLFRQTPIAPEPGKGPFDDQAPRQHTKAVWDVRRMLIRLEPDVAHARSPMIHDLVPPVRPLLEPVSQALISAAAPYQFNYRKQVVQF